jgi:type II secretory pathway component PulL
LRCAYELNSVSISAYYASERKESIRLAARAADRGIADRLAIAAKISVSEVDKGRLTHDGDLTVLAVLLPEKARPRLPGHV